MLGHQVANVLSCLRAEVALTIVEDQAESTIAGTHQTIQKSNISAS